MWRPRGTTCSHGVRGQVASLDLASERGVRRHRPAWRRRTWRQCVASGGPSLPARAFKMCLQSSGDMCTPACDHPVYMCMYICIYELLHMHMCICMCICRYTYLSLSRSLSLSLALSPSLPSLSLSLSICLSIYLPIYLSIYVRAYQLNHPHTIHPCTHAAMHPSHAYIHLAIHWLGVCTYSCQGSLACTSRRYGALLSRALFLMPIASFHGNPYLSLEAGTGRSSWRSHSKHKPWMPFSIFSRCNKRHA